MIFTVSGHFQWAVLDRTAVGAGVTRRRALEAVLCVLYGFSAHRVHILVFVPEDYPACDVAPYM